MDHDDVRALALALPEAQEHDHFGRPSFRVRNRIFITLPELGRAVLKLPREEHEALIGQRPDVFDEVTWGQLRRTGVALGAADRAELAELVDLAWRQVAPKRLVRERDAAG
jgi:hypothetical protein